MIFRILLTTFVRRFYRQNAGQLIFIFILFFGAVGELEGESKYTGPLFQLHYQYQLILGMLSSGIFMGVVGLAWFAYAEKCTRFVGAALQQKDHTCFYILNALPRRRLFTLFFRVQILLLLPLIIYSFAVLGVAIYKGWFLAGIGFIIYPIALCAMGAARLLYRLATPAGPSTVFLHPGARTAYWKFFLLYALRHQRIVFAGIKVISCGILFCSIRTLTTEYYDLRMIFLLFGIVIFGHSVLIYRFREWEESMLHFYRGLPVSLTRRLGQYALLYAIILIPEMIVIGGLTPAWIHWPDTLRLLLSGYSLLLLQNSLLFIALIPMRSFLKMTLGLFLLLYLAVMAGWLAAFSGLVLATAFLLFYRTYYRYNS